MPLRGDRDATGDDLMTDHLTAFDGTFLELEDADASAHMHIGGILVFGPPAATVEEVRAAIYPRLDALPRYRRRLAGSSARRPAAGRSCWTGPAVTSPSACRATGRCGRSWSWRTSAPGTGRS